MIYIKKIIFGIFTIIIFSTSVNAVIKDAIFATVGNQVITNSDIINEAKIILILNGQDYSAEKKEKLQSSAIQSLIRRNIKKIEVDKYPLEFDNKDINRELNKLTGNLGIDLDTLKNTLATNGIPYESIIDQIRIEILWNSLIFQIYKDRLSINIEEIEEQLKSIQDKKEIEEYLVSEIIIESVEKSLIESTIKKLKGRIIEEGFEKVATEISISETSIKGGDLGWLNENSIAEEFKKKITNTPIGNISDPVFLPQGILFFKVRDKRKVEKYKDLEDAKEQLIKAEKGKILNMHSLSHYDNLRRSISINYY